MRILGIDYGDKNIGLAISDKLQFTAQPFGLYRTINKTEDKKYFLQLASRYKISKIVIGLPLRLDGTAGTRVEKTKKFANWLKKTLQLPIIMWDERLTTRQANLILTQQKINDKKKKKLKDQVSANIILSSYLEHKRYQSDDQ